MNLELLLVIVCSYYSLWAYSYHKAHFCTQLAKETRPQGTVTSNMDQAQKRQEKDQASPSFGLDKIFSCGPFLTVMLSLDPQHNAKQELKMVFGKLDSLCLSCLCLFFLMNSMTNLSCDYLAENHKFLVVCQWTLSSFRMNFGKISFRIGENKKGNLSKEKSFWKHTYKIEHVQQKY